MIVSQFTVQKKHEFLKFGTELWLRPNARFFATWKVFRRKESFWSKMFHLRIEKGFNLPSDPLSEKRKRTLGTPFRAHKCASKLKLTGEMFEVLSLIHLTHDTV